ncbi:MAG: ATP-binding protein [Gemmatimonadaceae bacterium]|nr:ATP-binding protein [Gemmatimonadaceae bacterium]
MKTDPKQQQESEAQRDLVARLSAAILRINASLEPDTVLREVLDSARALTGARYGVITTVDEAGQVQDFVSSGIGPEEHRQLAGWSDGPRLFEHFRAQPGALRLDDLPAYVRSLGFSSDLILSKTFQGTPMRHRGQEVGLFFLAGKEDGQTFTPEDEEVLKLFASQAASAIANARTHRDEQRARADLEALVDTSPVGVVVLDARTGRPVSFNREAKRIVEGLRQPGRSLEQLPDVLTFRRADGREVSLEKLGMAQALSTGETLRAEEIVLEVPDGRRVRTLINATPIRSGDGEVESVVVTLQDLSPLEELERLRSEFLDLVSHELRAPLTSISGSAATVLRASPVPPPSEMLPFFRLIDEQAEHMWSLIRDLLDAGRIEAGTLSVTPEPSDVKDLVDQARTTFLGGGSRHTVLIDLPPDLPRVMADRPRIVQVLNNLLANAARHAPESSPIRIAAELDDVHVAISVSDEGRGLSAEELPHLFQKHTNVDGAEDRGLRGTGLGLAICKGLVEAHGGRIWAASGGVGQGAQFTFSVPVAGEAVDAPRPKTPGPRAHPGRERTRILVVDDDSQALRSMRETLEDAGYDPIVTGDSRDLSRILRAENPQLVLLDLMLPETDGIELMESVPELADRPVIFISVYGRDETIARALETGAADYIVKPFSPAELTARIRAALRRQEPESFVLGDLAIDYEHRRVTLGGDPVPLTVTEYELLRLLSVNAGRVVPYDSLMRQVWGGEDSANPSLVRTFVMYLRRKLGEDAARPTYILTVRGVGYRMATGDSGTA